MSDAKPHLRTLKEIERAGVPGLPRGGPADGEHRRRPLRPVGHDRLAPRYDPCVWRSRASDGQKRVGWEMWVRMEKIIATVLHEALGRQVVEAMDALAEGPEGFYGSSAGG